MALVTCFVSQDLLLVCVRVELNFANKDPNEVMMLKPGAGITEVVRVFEQRWRVPGPGPMGAQSVKLWWVEGNRYLKTHETWGAISPTGPFTIDGFLVDLGKDFYVYVLDGDATKKLKVHSGLTIQEVINRAGVKNNQARLGDCNHPLAGVHGIASLQRGVPLRAS